MKFKFLQRSQAKTPPNSKQLEYTACPLALGTNLGDYTIEKVLAQGQSGYTYVANGGSTIIQEYFPGAIAIRDTDGKSILLRDKLAKNSYEDGLSQFLLLARILSQIEHPGKVIHYQEEHDTAWYAVSIEPRASVGDLLRTGKRIPEEYLRVILTETLIYLETAHRHGIFHLELGPDQIILSSDETLVLCGFNVFKALDPGLRENRAAYYFSPEHLHTAGRLGPWSDFYGLGAILYQGLNPRIPPTAARRQNALEEGRPDPLIAAIHLGQGHYSMEFLDLIDSFLEISTGDRPANVRAVLKQVAPKHYLSDHNQADIPMSLGIPYDFQNPTLDHPQSDLGLIPEIHRTQDSHQLLSNNYRSNLISTSKADVDLMMAALGQISDHNHDSGNVADALERAGQILEPAESRRQRGSHQFEDSNYFPSDSSLLQNSNPGQTDQRKPREWTDLLRPRTVTSTAHQNIDSLGYKHQDSSLLKISTLDRWKKILFLRFIWLRRTALCLSLIGFITITGAWMWQEFQPTPIVEPTQIELLGHTENLPYPENFPTTMTVSQPLISRDLRLVSEKDNSLPFLIQRAERYEKEGAWFGNTDKDAYSTYREALKLDPSYSIAQKGINELVSKFLRQITFDLDQMKLDAARSLLIALRQRGLASDQIPRLEIQFQTLEQLQHSTELLPTVDSQKIKKELVIRHDKINELLNRASNAFQNGSLITPPGGNALTLYRAALDLDRNNQRARNGINSIFDRFLQDARISLSNGNLDQAGTDIKRATLVNKEDPAIPGLKLELKTRRDLFRQAEKIKTELAQTRASARKLALEEAKLNLKIGITAYYRGNYFEAYRILKPLADQDITRAQVRIATMLLEGRGVPPSRALATEWLLRALSSVQLAAARGEAWAQSDYGDYFADGVVMKQNFQQAVVWYRRSAQQGYSPAQANLGLMHMHGSGVRPNWNKAIEWFRTAAAKGNYAAQENLRLLEVKPKGSGS